MVTGMIDRVEGDHGPIDVLVNDTGSEGVAAFVEAGVAGASDPGAEAAHPDRTRRRLLPRRLERGRGHLLNVSSRVS